jgi:hypothetical protein
MARISIKLPRIAERVSMIEKHYAVHIKHMIDASVVNIRRLRPAGPKAEREAPAECSKFGRETSKEGDT